MLVGADVMYRFLKISQYPDLELGTLNRITREFLTATFNAFEFLTDLGLMNMHNIGEMYSDALDDLETKQEYVELTGAMMTYVIRMHRCDSPHLPVESRRCLSASQAVGGRRFL